MASEVQAQQPKEQTKEQVQPQQEKPSVEQPMEQFKAKPEQTQVIAKELEEPQQRPLQAEAPRERVTQPEEREREREAARPKERESERERETVRPKEREEKEVVQSKETLRALQEQFLNITVKDIIGDRKFELVTLKASDTIECAIKTLSERRFISAPVVNENNEFAGLVDFLDILKFIVKMLPGAKAEKEELKSLNIMGKNIATVPLSQVVNFSGKDPTVTVNLDSPATDLLKIFATGLHRAVILSAQRVVGLVTQTDVVRYMCRQLQTNHLKEVGNKSLKELGYKMRSVQSVGQRQTVLDGIRIMSDKNVGQLAVVDEESGVLKGNFSDTDLKGLKQSNFPDLLHHIYDYLEIHSKGSLGSICALPSSSLTEITNELLRSKMHHFWVIDEHFKPIGIITMTDILKFACRCE